ncbi:MAG TPA: zinc ribbon domain-containing protein [Acidobacteriota bacterium]|nr:zinc ribbon domain-containing protein [Acidobacteriota bacterium]
MNEMRKILLTVLIALFLCGCVDIDVRTTLQRGGGGIQKWRLTTTALLASRLKEQLQKNPYFRDRMDNLKEEFNQGSYTLSFQMHFARVSELESPGRQVQFERSGLFRRNYTYTETWKIPQDKSSNWLGGESVTLVPSTLKETVDMPGKIVESNADEIVANTATWTLRLQDLSETRTFRVRSAEWNRWIVIPLALILAGILLMALVIFVVEKRAAPRTALPGASGCPSCGKSVPSGSAFCNSCGAKL